MPTYGSCSRCGKCVYVSTTSRSEPVCRSCRREQPAPYGTKKQQSSCPVCGEQFVPVADRVKTCSRSCGGILRARLASPPGDPTRRKGRMCEICGDHYDANHKDQRTCGRVCGSELRLRELPPRSPKPVVVATLSIQFPECVQCGKVFATPRRRKFCSESCRKARDLALDPRRRPVEERVCRCGAPLGEFGRKLCDPCRKEARRRNRRRRRAHKRGAVSEPYTLVEIAVRDRNRCGLCGKRVAMTKQVPHPKAPVIDHVLPLACGGDDTRVNTQLAHFLCNSIKSDGGSQQLALVG